MMISSEESDSSDYIPKRRKIEKEKEVVESDEDENFGSVGSNPNNKKKINKKGEASDKSSEEPLTSGKDKTRRLRKVHQPRS